MKSYVVAIQMKPFQQYFNEALFIFFTIRENCVLEKFWPYLGAQCLKLNSEMEKNKYMQRRQAVRRKNIRKM